MAICFADLQSHTCRDPPKNMKICYLLSASRICRATPLSKKKEKNTWKSAGWILTDGNVLGLGVHVQNSQLLRGPWRGFGRPFWEVCEIMSLWWTCWGNMVDRICQLHWFLCYTFAFVCLFICCMFGICLFVCLLVCLIGYFLVSLFVVCFSFLYIECFSKISISFDKGNRQM